MADLALYDLATMLSIYREVKPPPPPFWLNWFQSTLTFDTPEIAFDRVYGDDRALAPFVLPTAMGKGQKVEGFDTLRFRPAYVKTKDVVDPGMFIERMAGENPIIGSMSIDQRRAAVKAELIRKARLKFALRNEWLAAKALQDGQVVIAGEDYPSVTVNFRRHADLSETLAGGARWSQGTADPLADLKRLRATANSLTGVVMTDFVMGAAAYAYFAARVDLKELMNRDYRGNDGNNVAVRTMGFDTGYEFVGVISDLASGSTFRLWTYTAKYIDPETGTDTLYLDTNTVIGLADPQGVRCFGAIMDLRAGYQPMEIFMKNWINEDPSVEYLLAQSAPLMVPKRPNATGKILVHS